MVKYVVENKFGEPVAVVDNEVVAEARVRGIHKGSYREVSVREAYSIIKELRRERKIKLGSVNLEKKIKKIDTIYYR